MSRLRRAGGKWRLLVHEWIGLQSDEHVGRAHNVTNDPAFGGRTPDGKWSRTHMLPANTELDELVCGEWLHLEQLDTGRWYLAIGGVRVEVTADRDGKPTSVTVYPAGTYDDAVPGCEYQDGRP